MNFDKLGWKTLESYFLNNTYYLTQHHLNSYDSFFNKDIFEIINEKNPIQISKNFDDTLDDFKFKIEMYIGGRHGNKIYFGKPVIYDERNTHYMYPNEARLRNMTYAFTIHYDVLVKYKFIKSSVEIIEGEIEIPKIYLGRFPIMLHSSKCILKHVNRDLKYNMGECKNDYGGYFIIDGKEKVVVPQEKFSDNMVYYKKNSDDDKYSYSSIIRMVSEDASKPVRTMKIHIVRDTDKMHLENIVVEIPNVRYPIPLFILMRALGVISDKEIIEYCLLDLEKYKDFIKYFKSSVYDAGTIFTQEAAIKYISQYLKFKNIPYTYHILCDFLLPQVGEMNFSTKAYFIGDMVFNLIKTSIGIIPPTDRDSFKYKRIELTGNLIYDLFKEYYNLQQKDIQVNVENDLYYHYTNRVTNVLTITESQLVSQVFSSEFVKDDEKDNKKKYKLGYNEIFKNKIVDNGFKRAFKGRWGATPNTNRVGVIQDLNRLSYHSFISHLRKINLPLDASAKVVGPRLCHASQYGLIDPVDTPDGGNCGLHKHLAITSYITNGYSYKLLLDWMRENLSIRLLSETKPSDVKNKTKIFINGTWLATTNELINTANFIKFARRICLIPIYTSIAVNYIENKIELYTDSGRITRPMFYVDEQKNLSTNCEIFRKKINESKAIDWNDILTGFSVKNNKVDVINNVFYEMKKLYNSDIEQINKHKSIVEYIDTAEMNTLLVSTNIEKLKQNKRSTHLEIHPSCIFGYMGNLVIYPETNPLPRNLFSCGQSKQAVSMYSTNFNNRVDKTGLVLNYGQSPLVRTKYQEYYKSENCYGTNTIVAIGCYGGYNVEDAILVNEGSLHRGLFRTTYYSTYETREESSLVKGNNVNSRFMNIEKMDVERKKYDYDYTHLDENGLIKENTKINDKVILIGKVTVDEDNINKYFDSSVKTKRDQLGFVDKTFITDDEEGFRLAKVRIRHERIPAMGDKMASRSGQKGTIGLIIPEEDMPFTEDGIKPDLIINPHAIPSRMTIGQLVETITGKVCCYNGNIGDCTSFQGVDHVDIFSKLLSKAGYESHGNELLYNGYTGEQLETSLFIGPTYYMRLKHMVKDKINYRARGRNQGLTKQPVHGRANDGGLRIGEMERDGVIGHGASKFLQESMMKRGDDYKIAVCNKTGTLAAYNSSQNILLSLFADGVKFSKDKFNELRLEKLSKFGRSFSLVEIPYCLKLLIQELQTMGIQTRLITEDNISQIENMSYSNNFKISARDVGDDSFKLTEIRQLLIQYGFIDRQNSNSRQNIRVEKEDDMYFEKVEDYDLHEFDEPQETPDSPPYAPSSPAYAPDSPAFAPGSPAFAPDSPPYAPGSPIFNPENVTPQPVDEAFENFKKEYINKYPDSHYGEHVYAYDKFKDNGELIAPDNIPEEEIKYGPTLDDIDRYSRIHQLGGKINMDIGGSKNKFNKDDDNFVLVAGKTIIDDEKSYLQPEEITKKESQNTQKKLEKEINGLTGDDNDRDSNSDSDNENNNNKGGSGKKILFELK
uniref:DNA-directed RNA polymerase n=1 Tax=viral metagenome TaxID=1070528 RepID=A0A6C0BTL6_9ZZZZ